MRRRRSDRRAGRRAGDGRGAATLRALLRGQAAATAAQRVAPHHFGTHALAQTFLEAAVLAAVAAALVDRTVAIRDAHVLGVLLHRPLEKAFAALTRAHAVMQTLQTRSRSNYWYEYDIDKIIIDNNITVRIHDLYDLQRALN